MRLTTMTARNGRVCCKTFTKKNGSIMVKSYDHCRRWDINAIEVEPDIDSLMHALERLSAQDNSIVVCGEPTGETENVLRVKYGNNPSLKDGSVQWFCVDVDKYDSPLSDPRGAAEHYIREEMPEPFHKAAHIVQLTASAGVREDLNMRLWFLLPRATSTVILRQIARTFESADTSIYSCVQPIYVNAPRFIDMEDPVKGPRLWRIKGEPYVDLTKVPEYEVHKKAALEYKRGVEVMADWEDREADPKQVQAAVERIRAQTTTGSRHHHALAAACELIGYGADPELVAAETEHLITRQGRAPQRGEIASIVREAVRKARTGQLYVDTTDVGDALDCAPTSDEQADEEEMEENEEAFGLGPYSDKNSDAENTAIFLDRVLPQSKADIAGFLSLEGEGFLWVGTHWESVGEVGKKDKLRRYITADAGALLSNMTIRNISNRLRDMFAFNTKELKKGGEIPKLDGKGKARTRGMKLPNVVNFSNGSLDMDTAMLDPESALEAPTPYRFCTSVLPYAFDAEATCPVWERCLSQWFPDDEESIRELQKVFGYILSGDTAQHKMFIFQGDGGRNGKGVVCHILRELLGAGEWVPLDLPQLSGQFGLEPLVNGVKTCFLEEANSGAKATAVDRLKRIVGEDPVSIEVKHASSVSHEKLPVRFVMVFNKAPRMDDSSGALSKRFHIIHFANSFYGREDKQLKEKLRKELPGIFNWALDGLRKLREDGKFIMPKNSEQTFSNIEKQTNPTGEFIRQALEPVSVRDPAYKEAIVSHADVFNAYCVWYEDNGLKGMFRASSQELVGAIGATISTAIYDRARPPGADKDTGPVQCWRGVRMTEEFAAIVKEAF